jgi:hypothetical protein
MVLLGFESRLWANQDRFFGIQIFEWDSAFKQMNRPNDPSELLGNWKPFHRGCPSPKEESSCLTFTSLVHSQFYASNNPPLPSLCLTGSKTTRHKGAHRTACSPWDLETHGGTAALRDSLPAPLLSQSATQSSGQSFLKTSQHHPQKPERLKDQDMAAGSFSFSFFCPETQSRQVSVRKATPNSVSAPYSI